MIIWKGPSQIDGKPIVLIASGLEGTSPNAKTGAMVQCYILRSDMDPITAVKTRNDVSICGNCRHMGKLLNGTIVGRSCYVTLMHGPRVVYDAYSRGVYPHATLLEAQAAFKGKRVRMGTYGDPAAIPFHVWAAILLFADTVTGYTHQWRSCDPQFKNYVMASCDTENEAIEAESLGYRRFRIRALGAVKLPGEVVCPASEEAGKKTTCHDCGACGGLDSKAKASIVIVVHGAGKGHFTKFARSQVSTAGM